MTRNTAKTRRLWIKNNGPIPKDKDNRAYEIHHLDGNKMNDTLSNLVCVPIEEHFSIHEAQEDWAACHRIAVRMNQSPEELSRLSSLEQAKRVKNGTHNFLGGKIQHERVANGSHHLLGGKIQSDSNKRQWELLGKDHPSAIKQREMIADRSHVFIVSNTQRLADGTHNWLQQWECSFCGTKGKNLSLFARWGHNDGRCLARKKTKTVI